MRTLAVLLVSGASLLAAETTSHLLATVKPPNSGPADWLAWQAARQESVAGTNGWATLVGLHWLAEGVNYAGSDPTNHAVLPPGRVPGAIGRFTRQGRTVQFQAAPGIEARVEGGRVRAVEMHNDTEPVPTRLQIGNLTIVVIARGERLGLRVRDPEAPARVHFKGLTCFPYDPEWRVEGRLERFAEPKTLRVPDITGETQEFKSPGELVFTREHKEFRLQIAEEPGVSQYFIMFRDLTSGQRTYPSGRFLYVERADPAGHVVIDFNRAYTPPCGFTAFATCPLPPRQNWLPFAVQAGELKPAGH